MLRAENIIKSYGSTPILKGVDLVIEKSELVSVIGDSGAGKTTLLQILSTLDKPDEGQIYINGQEMTKLKGNALASFRSQHIGFIFQFHNLLGEFTALENVCLPGYIAKKSKQEVEKRAKDLLDLLGVAHRLENKPSQLSGGEQQRVAVARALINQPAIVFADEPSGNLDSNNAKQLHELFFKLRNELEQTFVIVTHNNELAQLADRSLRMEDGTIK